jgi:hypothetical protein
MMYFLRRLFNGCTDHEDFYDRDREGKLELVCMVCGVRRYVLASPLLKGPCHAQGEVLGVPKTQVKRLGRQLPENVTPMRQVK